MAHIKEKEFVLIETCKKEEGCKEEVQGNELHPFVIVYWVVILKD